MFVRINICVFICTCVSSRSFVCMYTCMCSSMCLHVCLGPLGSCMCLLVFTRMLARLPVCVRVLVLTQMIACVSVCVYVLVFTRICLHVCAATACFITREGWSPPYCLIYPAVIKNCSTSYNIMHCRGSIYRPSPSILYILR